MVMIVVPAFMVRPSGSLHTATQAHFTRSRGLRPSGDGQTKSAGGFQLLPLKRDHLSSIQPWESAQCSKIKYKSLMITNKTVCGPDDNGHDRGPVPWFAPVVPSTQLPKLTSLGMAPSRGSAPVRVFHLATPSNPDIQHTQIHLPPVHPHLNLLLQSSTTQNLSQTVGNIVFARDKSNLPDLGSRSLANSMVANTQMLLRKLGLGD